MRFPLAPRLIRLA